MKTGDVVTYPAQIVFTESERVEEPRSWRGRLLRPSACIDVETGHRVLWIPVFDIVENAQTGRCTITVQGGPDKVGRRYLSAASVLGAQRKGIRWAGRRFRIPVDVQSQATA